MRILLVDDEKDFVKALKAILEQERYSVETAYDGEEALYCLNQASFDCVILDVMMPKLDGFSLLKQIRSSGNKTPVIFLSARADLDDRVKGLELGGDDYLPKPFSSKELLARLKAVLRRNEADPSNEMSFGDVKLDPSSYCLIKGDKKEALSYREYQILELFFKKPDRRYSAEEILNEAWPFDAESDVSAVWVHLCNARKKLLALGSKVRITSQRGVGYKMEEKDV